MCFVQQRIRVTVVIKIIFLLTGTKPGNGGKGGVGGKHNKPMSNGGIGGAGGSVGVGAGAGE